MEDVSQTKDVQNQDQNLDIDLDQALETMRSRFVFQKKFIATLSFIIFFCGVTAVLYSVFIFHNNLFNRLRYMTFNATIFSSISSLVVGIVCIWEIVTDKEMTVPLFYYLRLSSAVTEFVVFSVVMFGLLPIVNDSPDITSYTGIMMHLVVPPLVMISFILNETPRGTMTPWRAFQGTWFITLYSLVMLCIFGTGILPASMAPYSFLDFEHSSVGFIISCVLGVYFVGYCISWLLIRMNRAGYWLWYRNASKTK